MRGGLHQVPRRDQLRRLLGNLFVRLNLGRYAMTYFSLYSVYIQCEGFAKLTFCCSSASPADVVTAEDDGKKQPQQQQQQCANTCFFTLPPPPSPLGPGGTSGGPGSGSGAAPWPTVNVKFNVTIPEKGNVTAGNSTYEEEEESFSHI